MSAQLKTNAQVRRIFGLARARGLDESELHQIVEEETKQPSIRALTSAQADKVITRLGGESSPRFGGYGWCDPKGTSRRTVQHRRKRAGVVQVVPQPQLDLLADLAAQRSMSVEGLQSLFRRMHVHYPPRTTKEANKVIEALKAMNGRDSLCR
jgi:hypothetical protein